MYFSLAGYLGFLGSSAAEPIPSIFESTAQTSQCGAVISHSAERSLRWTVMGACISSSSGLLDIGRQPNRASAQDGLRTEDSLRLSYLFCQLAGGMHLGTKLLTYLWLTPFLLSSFFGFYQPHEFLQSLESRSLPTFSSLCPFSLFIYRELKAWSCPSECSYMSRFFFCNVKTTSLESRRPTGSPRELSQVLPCSETVGQLLAAKCGIGENNIAARMW